MTHNNFIFLRIRIYITKDNSKRAIRETLIEQGNGKKGIFLKNSN